MYHNMLVLEYSRFAYLDNVQSSSRLNDALLPSKLNLKYVTG
jgi:hypothetical protein